MSYPRSAGLLLHPTSLPGPYGIGDIGPEAVKWIDFLVESDLTLWQVLPLGPTGYGDSPYASFSSFAGNPMLISIDRLIDQGDLSSAEIIDNPVQKWNLDPNRVDFGAVIPWKTKLLRSAAVKFLQRPKDDPAHVRFQSFVRNQSKWLSDYSLFMAIKNHFDARAAEQGVTNSIWNRYWDPDIVQREPRAMERWRLELADSIAIQQVLQFFFFTQWHALKSYANERGVSIIGDLPIYVAQDSADVWSSPSSFRLDEFCHCIQVAGVPPDYFSATGQLWGNPVFNWDAMKQNGFEWWIRRFEGTRELVDIIRVDHFRGFEAGWCVPAGEATAVNGRWVKAPGSEMFNAVREALGNLPILAEDLGLITPEVDALRDENNFPGMRILQFAFDSGEERSNIFLPHNHIPNAVVYTGTHDNDTIVGWYQSRSDADRVWVEDYFGHTLKDVAWDFIRMTFSSVARIAIVPFQDVLGLDSSSRMNTPSTSAGNWTWRIAGQLDHTLCERLSKLVQNYDRGRRRPG